MLTSVHRAKFLFVVVTYRGAANGGRPASDAPRRAAQGVCGTFAVYLPPPHDTRDRRLETSAAARLAVQERGWVNEFLVKERLEVELLQAAGVVTDAPSYNKRVIKLNTALLYAPPPEELWCSHGPDGLSRAVRWRHGATCSYKQQKFNLLREESEGYSKLTVELDVALSRGGSPTLAEPLVRVVQSLIGERCISSQFSVHGNCSS